MGRAAVLLAGESVAVELRTISNHPDKAGLIGAVQLAPSWVLAGHDAILAADIGGTNLRIGVVDLKMKKKGDISKASVWKHLHWRHATTSRRARRPWSGMAEMARGADRAGRRREAQARALRRRRLPRPDRRTRRDRERRPEPAGQLGRRGLQPRPRADAPPAADRRPRARGRHAQRRRGPGPERSAPHDRRPATGACSPSAPAWATPASPTDQASASRRRLGARHSSGASFSCSSGPPGREPAPSSHDAPLEWRAPAS